MMRVRSLVAVLAVIPLASAFNSCSSGRAGLHGRTTAQEQQQCRQDFVTPVVLFSSSPTSGSNDELDPEAIGNQLVKEAKEVASCVGIVTNSLFNLGDDIKATDIVEFCDELDALQEDADLFVSRELKLRKLAMEFQRYELLVALMRNDYDAYVATAGFLSPSRIPRSKLPNLQDVPYDGSNESSEQEQQAKKPNKATTTITDEDGNPLVADCELENMEFNESPLDKLLLKIFRDLVEKNTGGVQSDKPGLDGLLEQGRTFMLQEGQTPEAQHKMVSDTLGGLMTPVLPPFYRIFMSGIVPKLGTDLDGKQLGPWFYAPFLTSFVTPTFFGFLVGPSYPNRRKDGQPGGLVVEKCKFLQESGCKGICLHQCKLPAQQFFKEELGLPLTVTPNFVTQECQWSFGEEPLPPADEPTFPKGCLVGCESRKQMVGRVADVCN
ncbi:expressed unknown protein [Seminavis robusta]|uniref:Beta-carotene isomerase D27-like C-terminal domain-containing protein n=1 Tax=Seminavis robusta TaxID=568900 RepID=A0A9N8EX14_9STRA|nr:expressed unknown protein [Seminavis robusta]|eukprot:Sro1946_g307070.1 n/a (438) ;mRNA; r:14489-15802